MQTLPYLVHALSPLHAGTGQASEIVDLPIARLKATGIPYLPGSSVKGVLRYERKQSDDGRKVAAVFGPESTDSERNAGALSVGDARLLALPVRSFRGTFAWATSPLLLSLAHRDLRGAGAPNAPAPLGERVALVASLDGPTRSLNVHVNAPGQAPFVYLEDLDLPARQSDDAARWAQFLGEKLFGDGTVMARRLAIVDDETMDFLCQTATQLDARVRLDPETRVADSGALWLEESLPAETILVGLMAGDRSRRAGVDMADEEVLLFALPERCELQFGGKATVGRGRCSLVPVGSPLQGGMN